MKTNELNLFFTGGWHSAQLRTSKPFPMAFFNLERLHRKQRLPPVIQMLAQYICCLSTNFSESSSPKRIVAQIQRGETQTKKERTVLIPSARNHYFRLKLFLLFHIKLLWCWLFLFQKAIKHTRAFRASGSQLRIGLLLH